MVGASKILTVSYGTFSCTLEGFDDSFDTMKAIAEYFRDLASDDRYFGAEPPTPDAEMLQRIAQREINKQVEARVGETGIVLRAADDDAAAPAETAPVAAPAPEAVAAPTPEPAPEPTPQPAPIAAPVAQTPVVAEQPAVEFLTPDTDSEAGLGSVAARLARIRAVVDTNEAAPDPGPFFDADPQPEDAELVEEPDEAPVAETAATEDVAPGAETVETPEAAATDVVAEAEDISDDTAEDADEDAAAFVADLQDDPAPIEDAPVAEAASDDTDTADATPEEVEADEIDAAPLTETDDEAPLTDIADEATIAAAPDDGTGDDALLASVLGATGALAAATAVVASDDTEGDAEDDAEEAVSDTETLADWDNDDTLEDDNEPLFADPAPAEDTDDADTGIAWDADDAPTLDADAINTDALDALIDENLAITEPEADETEGFETFDDADDDADIAEPDMAEADAETVDTDETDETEMLADTALDADDDADFGTDAAEDADGDAATSDDAADLSDDMAPLTLTPEEAVAPEADAEDETSAGDASDDTASEEEIAPPVSEKTRAALERARARVLKVKKVDLAPTPAPQPEEAETPDEEEAAEAATVQPRASVIKPRRVTRIDREAPAPEPATQLSDEDEADLMAELEALRDEPVDSDDTPPMGIAPRAQLDEAAEQPEESVSRLVDEVNTMMDGPEHRRRRSAIAHLKAAVAATVAERSFRKNKTAEEEAAKEEQPYRQDLEAVVQPKQASDAPAEAMPPLMLVSEQRIDTPAADAPARPVAHGNLALAEDPEEENIFDESENFEQFAARVDAKELPELLEAAAAFMLQVEDEPYFTRPKVMRAAARIMGNDNFEREDGLRAFGTLLREGPFERVQRGQFTLSKTSRFMN